MLRRSSLTFAVTSIRRFLCRLLICWRCHGSRSWRSVNARGIPAVCSNRGWPVPNGKTGPWEMLGGPASVCATCAARSLGVTLQIQDIRNGDDLPAAFDAGAKERAEGLLTTAESMFVVHRARVTELAARYRLPAMYCYSTHVVDFGGLLAYDVNIADLFRRAGTYVDRILKGAKPSDLPIHQPTKFEFVINLKTAKTLGLAIPPGVLAIADEVIE